MNLPHQALADGTHQQTEPKTEQHPEDPDLIRVARMLQSDLTPPRTAVEAHRFPHSLAKTLEDRLEQLTKTLKRPHQWARLRNPHGRVQMHSPSPYRHLSYEDYHPQEPTDH